MQLRQAVDGFMEGYFSTSRMSEKTRAAYGIDLAQLQREIGADKPLCAIDVNSLEGWARKMQVRGYAAVSIRRKFAAVRVFFAYWIRRGTLESSPLWKIRLDLGRQRLLPRSLTGSHAKRLIEEIWREVNFAPQNVHSPRDARFLALRNVAVFEILFATGMRVGELVNLGIRDWREDDSAFVVMGKGQRQRLGMMPDEWSRRAVKMYLLQRVGMNLGHEGLLVNASGNMLSPQGVARVVAETADRAGLGIRVTPHMIRHTVATLLLRCGADIRVVQEVLGHASISTTQRYTYVSKEHLLATLRAHHPSNNLHKDLPSLAIENQLVLPMH